MILRMSSKRRRRRLSCEGKLRFPDKQAAIQALRDSKKTGRFRGAMHSYPCGNHWHNGHVGHTAWRRFKGLMSKREFQS